MPLGLQRNMLDFEPLNIYIYIYIYITNAGVVGGKRWCIYCHTETISGQSRLLCLRLSAEK